MSINLSSKRSKLIILISFFVVFVISGGYLLWRVNQPETVAPEESEAAACDGYTYKGAGGCQWISISSSQRCCKSQVSKMCSSHEDCAATVADGCGEPGSCNFCVDDTWKNSIPGGCYKSDNYCWMTCKAPSTPLPPPTPTQHTVTYNANGGTCTKKTEIVEDRKSSLGPGTCTRTGYVIKDFTRSAGGCESGWSFSAGTCKVVIGALTVTANWELATPTSYTVTYSPGAGGSCTPTSRTVTSGGTSTAPSCTREGYTLKSFSRTSGSGGTLNKSTGTVTSVTGNQTITANWDPIPDPGCGDRARIYPHTTTTWPSGNTQWCEIGTPSSFDPDQNFPQPGESISWVCTSGTYTANCTASTDSIPEEPEEEVEEEVEEPVVVPEAPTVPETGIFDDSQTAVLVGLVLLFLGFTWRILGRGMYLSIEILGKVPKKISIHMKDVKEDIQAKKRVQLLKKKELNRKKFEKKVVKD